MRYYKGNLHMHTTRSDGVKTPGEALRLYKAAGYDFVALTDHYVYGEGGEAENGLLVISGAEYDTGTNVRDGIYHIVGLGMERDPGMVNTAKPCPQEIIDRIHQAGGLAVLAHPAWSLDTPEDIARKRGFDMLEIYNTLSGKPWNCRPYSGLIADMLAAQGIYYPLTAVDDAHFYVGDECRSYVMVRAEELTQGAILAAIRRGDFYATQGPEFEYRAELYSDGSGLVSVDCTPIERTTFFTDRVYTPDRCAVGRRLTHVEYRVKPGERFVRFELEDAAGNAAWSGYVVRR